MTAKAETKPVAPAPKAATTPPKTDAKAPDTSHKMTDSDAKPADLDTKPAETDAKTPEVTEKAPTGETTTIKVLRSHPKLGAWPGAVTTIPTALAAELIAGEFAREASAEELAQVETSGYTETI